MHAMLKKTPALRAIGRFATRLTACTAPALLAFASAGHAAASYSTAAPVEANLMDRAQEIALARSAAPASVSKDATVLVLTRTGYETAVNGTNGFVCMVGRGFGGAFDWPERLNPKIRAAECLNPAAARSVMPFAQLRTAMYLAGRSKAETLEHIKAALASKEIPPLEAGAMSYMMSKTAYLTDEGDHAMPHVMFFVPVKDGAEWGANAADTPIIGGSYWAVTPGGEAETAGLPTISVFISGVCNWSDGTPATAHHM